MAPTNPVVTVATSDSCPTLIKLCIDAIADYGLDTVTDMNAKVRRIEKEQSTSAKSQPSAKRAKTNGKEPASRQKKKTDTSLHFDPRKLSWPLRQTMLRTVLHPSRRARRTTVKSVATYFEESVTEINLNRCELNLDIITAVATRCPLLENLDVSDSQMCDESVAVIAEKCSELRSLSLQGCRLVSGDALIAISKGVPKLEALSIGGCFNVDNASIQTVVNAIGSRLTTLCVSGCGVNTETLHTILDKCPKLTTVAVGFSDGDLPAAELLRLCVQLSGLRSLELHWSDTDDKVVKCIAETMTNLTNLDISGCRLISDEGLAALGGHSMLKTLRVSRCRKVTHEAIANLRATKRELEVETTAPKVG